MSIVETIKNFVEEECKKPTSKYGYQPFIHHFTPMVNHAATLADEYACDKEVVLLAAWLHDIGSIIYGRENHHVTGAEIAEQKLTELSYPTEKIALIKKCILNHRGSQDNERVSTEEQIIAEADALSNFDNIAGIFMAAFLYEGKDQSEARTETMQKLERKWRQLKFEKSKELAKPKYDAAKLLLS